MTPYLFLVLLTSIISPSCGLVVNCHLSKNSVYPVREELVSYLARYCDYFTYCCATVSLNGLKGDLDDDVFEAAKMAYPSLKLLMAFGGSLVTRLTRNTVTRQLLVKWINSHVTRYGYHGVFIMWQTKMRQIEDEDDPLADRNNLARFLVDLRQEFGRNFTIGLQGPQNGDEKHLAGYPCDTIDKTVDMVDLNTRGSHDGVSMSPAPLHLARPSSFFKFSSINVTVARWLKCSVSRSKLLIRVSPLVAVQGTGYRRDRSAAVTYKQICNYVSNYSWIQDWALPVSEHNASIIIFENEASLEAKIKYASHFGLAGMAVHDVQYSDQRGSCGQGPYPILSWLKSSIDDIQLDGTSRDLKPNQSKSSGDLSWKAYLIASISLVIFVAIAIVYRLRCRKHVISEHNEYDIVYYTSRFYAEVIG
ncbi:Chitotriosidase-1 [Halotydeus destructor]|nr:Chitotriosidase-1 [Halotydeus destructor]